MLQTDTIYFSEKLLCLSASSIQSTKTVNEFSPVLSNQSITIISIEYQSKYVKLYNVAGLKAKKKYHLNISLSFHSDFLSYINHVNYEVNYEVFF